MWRFGNQTRLLTVMECYSFNLSKTIHVNFWHLNVPEFFLYDRCHDNLYIFNCDKKAAKGRGVYAALEFLFRMENLLCNRTSWQVFLMQK